MDPTPRMQRHDRPVDGAVLEPTPAIRRPRRALHEDGDVRVEVLDSGGFWSYRLDALGLDLLHDVDHIFRGVLENGEDGAVSDWGVGPEEHWTVSDGDFDVWFRSIATH